MDLPPCPGCRERDARIVELERRILTLETRLRDVEDKLKSPSPKVRTPQPPAPAKKPTGKKRGAQPGHKPHIKKWLPRERIKEVIQHLPEYCQKCERPLSVEPGPADPGPTIHQVAELPRLLAEITQHEGHSRSCCCGHITHASIPIDVRNHSIGPHLTAAIVYFAGSHGMSKRGIEETVETLFGVPIALGTIANLEQEASEALKPAYQEARQHVAEAEVKHIDETGWKEAGKKRWLWAAATMQVVLFLIHPRRNLDALKLLLGKLSGVLISDRWCVYDGWEGDCRQLCWAHVKRNWDKQIERGGQAKKLGDRWLATQKKVFELWHLFRGGGCTRDALQRRLEPHMNTLGELLLEGKDCRDRALARHCERLLKHYPMLWLFSTVEGVEPTNNHAERVQRRAVLWRRKSFGCQSQAGCRFVERILTAVQTLRVQERNTLQFLGQCITNYRQGLSTPTLCTSG